jgi:cysteine synthase A
MSHTIRLDRSLLSAVGDTPLLEPEDGLFIKCEFLNPTGSIKARLATYLVHYAEQDGILTPGMTIVEATSGNTGNALAMVAAAKGYKMVMVMPEGFSNERVAISKGFGAEIRLTPGHDVTAARDLAIRLGEQEGWWCPRQFDTPLNVENNEVWLGQEIIKQIPTGVKIDAIVQGVGTGGTLIGVARALRQHHNPDLQAFALEPAEAPTLKDGSFAPHAIEGIGDGFVPNIFNRHRQEVDGLIHIKSADALAAMKHLARLYGTFVGPSSGANWLAAQQLQRDDTHIQTVLTFFCDVGEKYLTQHYMPEANHISTDR